MNVQNISNLIGREEHKIGRFLLSVSILCSLTKKRCVSAAQKNRFLSIKNKLITIYAIKIICIHNLPCYWLVIDCSLKIQLYAYVYLFTLQKVDFLYLCDKLVIACLSRRIWQILSWFLIICCYFIHIKDLKISGPYMRNSEIIGDIVNQWLTIQLYHFGSNYISNFLNISWQIP